MIIILILLFLFFFMAVGVFSQFPRFRAFNNISAAMENTIFQDERVMVNFNKNYKYSIQKNDIIVFDYGNFGQYRVFRVIALENDEIEIVDNDVYVNGILINEPYKFLNDNYSDSEISDYFIKEAKNFPLTKIDQNKIFVLGDNRYNSRDSRVIGQIHMEFIVGKVLYIYFSNEIGRIGKKVE